MGDMNDVVEILIVSDVLPVRISNISQQTIYKPLHN